MIKDNNVVCSIASFGVETWTTLGVEFERLAVMYLRMWGNNSESPA